LHSATRFANPGTRPAPGDLARVAGSADAPETAMPRGARRRLGLGRAGERVWAAGTHDATMRTERVLRACAWCSAAAPCDGRRTSSGASGAGQRSGQLNRSNAADRELFQSGCRSREKDRDFSARDSSSGRWLQSKPRPFDG
jgi:hypothetical protein